MERFPSVPVEVWPIQKFTYLEPSRWNGTFSVERKPHIDAYWETCDQEFCDGPGAESFATLLRRAEAALPRLEASYNGSQVPLFSLGQFIHAVRMIVLYPEDAIRKGWDSFWRRDGLPSVSNGELVSISRTADGKRHGSPLTPVTAACPSCRNTAVARDHRTPIVIYE